eukprot:776458-Lingulodinium_polyedra.AAC.1
MEEQVSAGPPRKLRKRAPAGPGVKLQSRQGHQGRGRARAGPPIPQNPTTRGISRQSLSLEKGSK